MFERWKVVSPFFTTTVDVEDDIVVHAASPLQFLTGRKWAMQVHWFRTRKGYKVQLIQQGNVYVIHSQR